MPGRDQQAVGGGDPPARPGSPKAYDHEYRRNGVSNRFMLFAPVAGWRRVEVRERRTRVDWAEVIKKLVDEDFPHKERIALVMDNLNTHHPASLYEAFEPGAAHRGEVGDTLHPQARQLAEPGGERVGGTGPAMPGPSDSNTGGAGTGNPNLAATAQRRGNPCPPAFHHPGRPNQAEAPLPINTIAMHY